MPDGRTNEYAVFKACERFRVKPPGVRDNWEDCDLETKALMLSYSQIREDEDAKVQSYGILSRIG